MKLSPIQLDVDPLSSSPLPVDLDLIKLHCSVDGDDHDQQLEVYLLAAIQAFEDSTHRTLLARDHRWVLRDFPRWSYQWLHLPRGKTRSVAKIEYVRDGQTVTLTGPSSSPAGTDYLENLSGDDGGVLMPPQGGTWPDVDLDHPAPVTITFTAGWQPEELPADVLHTLLFSVRIMLDDLRGSEDATRQPVVLRTFEALASPYRLSRFY